MDNKQSKFKKTLNLRDILAIAFGAMIGWGWVINSGDWLSNAGVIGSVIAFLFGGIMVLFVGLTYAELTAAMPKCGGEHEFSMRAFGPNVSFVTTWAIILGYLATAAFEAAAFPTVIRFIAGNSFNWCLLYYVGDTPIYLSYVLVGVGMAILITILNIVGIKKAAVFQKVLTIGIIAVALLLVGSSIVNGNLSNISDNLFGIGNTDSLAFSGGILTVTCMTPFLFVGFDVIPQAAEEIETGYKKLAKILLLSIVMTVVFYLLIVFAVSNLFSSAEIIDSMSNGLVTADAMSKGFGTKIMGYVLVGGGMCGIVTSWNSFIIGGSRAMYAMGESHMLPSRFAKLNKKTNAPTIGILLGGILCCVAPFFGKPVLIWLVDAAGFGCCVAYFLVSLSFLILRVKNPEMERPFKIKHWKIVGAFACLLSLCLVLLYIIPLPFSDSALVWQEWIVVGFWGLLGFIFFVFSKTKYKKDFGKPLCNREDEK